MNDEVIILCNHRPIFRGRMWANSDRPVDAYTPEPNVVILRPASADDLTDAEVTDLMSELQL